MSDGRGRVPPSLGSAAEQARLVGAAVVRTCAGPTDILCVIVSRGRVSESLPIALRVFPEKERR